MNRRLVLLLLGIVVVLVLVSGVLLFVGRDEVDNSVVTLYYVNQDEFKLGRQQEVIEGEKTLESSLTALFNSEGQGGLENLFPEGLSLIGTRFDEEEGVFIVNLTDELLSINYGPEVNYLVVMSIVYVASEESGYSAIKLLFNGEVVEYLQNTLYMGGYFKKDADVLE